MKKQRNTKDLDQKINPTVVGMGETLQDLKEKAIEKAEVMKEKVQKGIEEFKNNEKLEERKEQIVEAVENTWDHVKEEAKFVAGEVATFASRMKEHFSEKEEKPVVRKRKGPASKKRTTKAMGQKKTKKTAK